MMNKVFPTKTASRVITKRKKETIVSSNSVVPEVTQSRKLGPVRPTSYFLAGKRNEGGFPFFSCASMTPLSRAACYKILLLSDKEKKIMC